MTLEDEVEITPLPLPAELAARFAVAKVARDAAIARSAALCEQYRPTLPDARVLVVDDHAALADGLAELIHSATGAEVIPVTSATVALHLAATAPHGCYCAAIIDLDLGHHSITGATVAKALPRGVAVILVTGVAHGVLEEAALDVSAHLTLEKPLEGEALANLVEAVRECLPRGRREREDSIH